MKKRRFFRLLLTYSLLAFMTAVIIYPLLWTVGVSFNPGNSLVSTSIIPANPTLDHYKELFAGKESLQYGQWYINSLKISIFTMIGSVISVSFTAYAFSRFRFKGRKNALVLFLLLQMIPQFSALVALFVLAQMLGMMNSHWLLILLYIGGLIPMNTYLMKGYMDSIPIDLDESAKIDGASNTRIFLQIIMPLSKPMIAVVAMNGFTGPLGDFVLSSTILRTPESYTLPIGLYNLVNEVMGASYTTFAAGAILISIPVAVIFIMLQKNFVSGLTAGGTKG
ncbi:MULTISPECIES: sugar ABC transporter permease [Bacillus]|uniref:Binding-protein-dependent transport system, inner membrane component protein n=1 Tax=Bacillus licheniformis (strain ATCC 14580 / DSM 13 / JCM 2505 / CCUG 7422 / NBRC 12200 / NCIMB 9375 / NCTC 10341 / NRRL NRS-1264 / Gibson 46) TaxID=279010 RepID=Q65CX3_BACLD|nr:MULTISPECIES: sugar ABC transporter permease [Bacillus]AAU25713.1 Binding-protein-dependent transport system, inner membrane component protein [Bacillus licheniformis DSM 13 = ATCC 14580]AAU43091.1 carbohydrate ABC transporter permease GanQ [Bacillus licheniformis DSM 13 = ATCC 14580]MBG9694511.1 arabinogalactan oligomer transport system permease GanQ [Bacillus licheniformis]MCR3916755.1 sugar ABC transporter permease [Bacillus licheniformis]MDH3165432.1 sugar ABC transporter permease [Baci